MSKLRIPLTGIPESGVRIDSIVPRAELRPDGADDLAVGVVRVSGTLQRSGEDYFFEGVVSGAFAHQCDRCLDEVVKELETPVAWLFRRGADREPDLEILDSEEFEVEPEEELLVYGFEGHELDLAPQTWEELVLLAPVKYLCRSDCAGLCPRCGANLNRDTCGCSKEEPMSNKGLADLGKLFPDLTRRPPEE